MSASFKLNEEVEGCYREDELWYNAKIVEIIMKPNEMNVYRVHYYEYGNEEYLTENKVRPKETSKRNEKRCLPIDLNFQVNISFRNIFFYLPNSFQKLIINLFILRKKVDCVFFNLPIEICDEILQFVISPLLIHFNFE